MSAASDYSALLDRIYEVLVDGEGGTKALAAGERFALGIWPGQPDEQQAIAARATANSKAVWVDIIEGERGDALDEIAAEQSYVVTVEVLMAYAAEAEAQHEAWRSIVATAATDKHRIRNALGRPGNLTQTEAGTDTGIASGLTLEGWSKTGPDPVSRLLSATATFTARVMLTA